jgi:hypothetical protein
MKKITIIIMAMVGGLALRAAPADPTTSSSLSAVANAIQKPAPKVPVRLFQPAPVDQNRVQHLGKISSRPWTQVATTPEPVPFVDDHPYNAEFRLFTINFK